MNIDLGSFAFGVQLEDGVGTPSWGTALGQGRPEYYITRDGADELVMGMVYKSVPLSNVSLPLGRGGRMFTCLEAKTIQIASLFDKVYVNGERIMSPFIMVLQKEDSASHSGRRGVKYSDKAEYHLGEYHHTNAEFVESVHKKFGLSDDACWFVYDISIRNHEELHMKAIFVNKNTSEEYLNSKERSEDWTRLIKEGGGNYNIVYNHNISKHEIKNNSYRPFISAIRTKPFLLLAGISGTGKSRIVRELAFKSCPKYLQDKDGTTPGNYCMIEVKPNWHDSTELLGYYSNLNKGYQFKKFVKFLIKAKMFPTVPFFVCLDEMNLAPVEQYFAEILSVLETRKVVVDDDGTRRIKTGAIIEAEHFKALSKLSTFDQRFTDRDIYMKLHDIDTEYIIADDVKHRMDLTTEGLTLPDNVVIIGTVNMDDTTHQFSRKVIDRAMTIEMNGGKLKNMFGASHNLSYLEDDEQQKWQATFCQNYVTADEVLAAHPDKASDIVRLLPEKLEAINEALRGTPFEVSYRVLNELTIMVGVMLDDTPDENIENIVNNALDRILLMKVLPRIEGDSDMFNLKVPVSVGNAVCRDRLEWLRELAPIITVNEDDEADHQQTAKEKIMEMKERLDNQEFTRFWP